MSKIAVITGGSKGIGLATAERFKAAGYNIVNISRSPSPMESVHHITADFSQQNWQASVADNLRSVVKGASSIALIHNAAVLYKDSIDQLPAEQLRFVMEVGLVAPAILNQLLLPAMLPGSSILYIGSTLGEKAVANAASYVISKHALVGLMRSTCQDLAGRNIHTACICPGFTDTQMLRQHVGHDESILNAIGEGVTQGRLLQPEEIAKTIEFCAENPAINGAVIHANLGQIEH